MPAKPIVVTIDYETFYDSKSKFSLRNMGNEEYILDRRFHVHGCAIAIGNDYPTWFTHPETKRFFAGLNWSQVILVSHNSIFDAAITSWIYGYMAGGYIDTMGLANAFIRPFTGSSSLKACAEYEGWDAKSGVLSEVNGKRTEEIKLFPGLYERLGEYACEDASKCNMLRQKYYPRMSQIERVRMDWAVRNSIRGRLRIDMAAMHAAYAKITSERDTLLAEAGIDKATARSRSKFATYLESLGIEVEYKRGKNDAEIPAIAKDDPFVADMLAHGDPAVVAAMRARLAFASSIAVTRAERLLKMGHATKGKMLLPTVWHAAHTGRPGGTDGVNPTNFPKPKPGKPALISEAIKPPSNHVLLDADASQIEARLMVWIAGCQALLEAFSDARRDIYCEVASAVFDREITPDMELERQVGKVTALSAQYGVGWRKTMLRLQALGINITEDEAKRYIWAYRTTYPEILGNGKQFIEFFMEVLYSNIELEWKGCVLARNGIKLPSGRWIYYDHLRVNNRGIEFYSHRYKSWQSLHAGFLNENLCQAMTNDHVGRVQVKYIDLSILMLYDSVVLLIPETRIEELQPALVKDLCTPSPWMAKVADGVLPPLGAKCKVKHHF